MNTYYQKVNAAKMLFCLHAPVKTCVLGIQNHRTWNTGREANTSLIQCHVYVNIFVRFGNKTKHKNPVVHFGMIHITPSCVTLAQ